MSRPLSPTSAHTRVLCAQILFVLGGLVMLTACVSTRHPTVDELRQVPGATSFYPAAVTYFNQASEGAYGVDSGSPSSIHVFACTDPATQDTVSEWFGARLTAAGWIKDPGHAGVDPSTHTGGSSWTREQRHFELRFPTTAYTERIARGVGKPAGCRNAYESYVQ